MLNTNWKKILKLSNTTWDKFMNDKCFSYWMEVWDKNPKVMAKRLFIKLVSFH